MAGSLPKNHHQELLLQAMNNQFEALKNHQELLLEMNNQLKVLQQILVKNHEELIQAMSKQGNNSSDHTYASNQVLDSDNEEIQKVDSDNEEIQEVLPKGKIDSEEPSTDKKSNIEIVKPKTVKINNRQTNFLKHLKDLLLWSKPKDKVQGISSSLQNALLVVAVLIATITYQAGLTPPPSIWKDTGMRLDVKCMVRRWSSSEPSLRHCRAIFSIYFFTCCNTAGLASSLGLILVALRRGQRNHAANLLGFSIFTMVLTYLTSLLSTSSNALSFFFIWVVLFVLFLFYLTSILFLLLVKQYHQKLKRRTSTVDRSCSFASFFLHKPLHPPPPTPTPTPPSLNRCDTI